MIKIYIDAATNQSTNTSAGGMIVIKDKQQQQIHHSLMSITNNEAEFEMLVFALNYSLSNNWQNQTIFIYSDSKIVIQSIEKKYAKDERFKPFLTNILSLMNQFDLLFIEWIEEKQNKGADHLAKQALQKRS